MTPTIAELMSVQGLTAREAADKLPYGKTTIAKYRKMWASGELIEEPTDNSASEFKQSEDGTVTLSVTATNGPLTLEDALLGLTTRKVDLTAYNVSYSLIDRELANGETRSTYTIRATPRKGEAIADTKLDTDELVKAIEKYDFTPMVRTEARGSFVLCPSDMQIGKTSFNGGTAGTVERVLESFHNAASFAKEFKPREIIIAELGDPIENFYSTSSQRETNDLDITGQIRTARRLLLEGIKQLAPLAGSVKYAAVPSNHGSVRIGFKAPAGDNHNDWGLEIASQLEDAVRENPTLGHVTFHRPQAMYESMLLETGGTKLGMVHGHQSKGAEKLGEWWKGQDHGRQPVADADILLAGHWHSFRVQHSGNGRWVMVSPAQDPGSDWFTNITGEWSETGMLSFTTEDGKWENLQLM